MSDEWQLYKRYYNSTTAQIIQAMLKENGIETILMDKKDSMYGHGYVELYVSAKDYLTTLALNINIEDE